MKKRWITGITALLALVIMSCGGFIEPETEIVPKVTGYKNDREIMQLSIGLGGGNRALTDTLAKTNLDYFEVAFMDSDGDVHRTSWNKGYPANISIPVDEYYGADKAILFAGKNDRTLLAVGIISQINGTPISGTSAPITPTTTSVTFKLLPLLNNITDDNTTSTFSVTSGFVSDESSSGTPSIPIYVVDTGSSVTADYKIGIGDSLTNLSSEGINHYNGIAIDLTTTPADAFKTKNSSLNPNGTTVNLTGLSIANGGTGAAALFPNNGTFNLGFTTPTDEGFAELTINIPAYAIKKEAASLEWFIRGGLQNDTLDAGNAANSLGGAVLIAVGDDDQYVNIDLNNIIP